MEQPDKAARGRIGSGKSSGRDLAPSSERDGHWFSRECESVNETLTEQDGGHRTPGMEVGPEADRPQRRRLLTSNLSENGVGQSGLGRQNVMRLHARERGDSLQILQTLRGCRSSDPDSCRRWDVLVRGELSARLELVESWSQRLGFGGDLCLGPG
jgi:hypothetical protein